MGPDPDAALMLAQTYDPHSEYLSPSDLENFQISMKLSLVQSPSSPA